MVSFSDIPVPYSAIRPVLADSWFWRPFFSTNCCAMTSPAANRTVVAMLCVKIGCDASLRWYLGEIQHRTKYVNQSTTNHLSISG